MCDIDDLECAIFSLDEAISSVNQLGKKYEDDLTTLRIIRSEMQESLNGLIETRDAMEQREQAALEREYWKSR